MNVAAAIQSVLRKEVRSLSPLSGGSISTAYRADLYDGASLFIKVNPQSPDMFIREAEGLTELQQAGCIRVPSVFHADTNFLILEYLPAVHPANRKRFFERFGRSFALLHRHTSAMYGFTKDNYIGSTPQRNEDRSAQWRDFFWNHRLRYQFLLAEKKGYVRSDLRLSFSQLEKELNRLIPEDGEPPALLHGDLWSGNYLCLEGDTPALIDPAIYYGHREADIAMTLLFGGFSDAFYDAYNQEYPMTDGWERRMELYKLYHLFNHLNLFGEGYYGQVIESIKKLTR